MKRIFTILLALGAFTAAQSQSSRSYPDEHNRDRDVILGQRNESVYDNNSRSAYSFSERERDKMIDRINRDYDKQIRKVERDRRMRSSEKSYQIRRLEDQRREEIRRVWERYRNSSNTAGNDRYRQNNRRW
jgi:hypothetical protein